MNLFERFLYFLQGEMTRPEPYGWFHLSTLALMFLVIFILYKRRHRYSEKQLKRVLLIYGIIAFLLELFKQLIWAFNYDEVTSLVSWNYDWYSAPFQLCTTPIYISLICAFLKKDKLRDALLSYIAYYTILGSVSVIILPGTCFVKDILVNIHTTFMHYGSFIVSVFLMMNKEVLPTKEYFIKAVKVFLVIVTIALSLDLIVYNTVDLTGNEFNMFYISPYYTSELPIFDKIQMALPYPLFLLIYILIVTLGAFIIYFINKMLTKKK